MSLIPKKYKRGSTKQAYKTLAKVGDIAAKRYSSKGNVSIPKILKDVMYLKSLVNAEKKTFPLYSATALSVGQVNGNGNGGTVVDITPIPAQGTTSITRNGNSIRLHSTFLRMQLSQMSAATNPVRIKIQLIAVKGVPITANFSSVAGIMYDPNPFVGGATIYDLNSSYNMDYANTYTVLRTKVIKLKEDSYAGQNQLIDISMGMKYAKKHIKFSTDGAQTVADGQLILVFTADGGNISNVTASTLSGIPNGSSAINTGTYVNYNLLHYFYDN